MIIRKVVSITCQKLLFNNIQRRNIQVCVVSAASDIGSNLAILLKQNSKITRLHLYDDDEKVMGIGVDLGHIPGGPKVIPFAGDIFLPAAVRFSDIIVMTSKFPRKPGFTRRQLLASSAPSVLKLCRTMSQHSPDAFLALSTNPLNSVVPLASALLYKYNTYNPNKILGITHLDIARAKSLIGQALNVNPRHVYVPVIGGHSDKTIVPLFSYLSPSHHTVDDCQAETLTRLLKRAGNDVITAKQGRNAAILAVAWSVYEFVDQIIEVLCYEGCVMVNAFTLNSSFGSRFFSGPVKLGSFGVIETCKSFNLSDYERNVLNEAVPELNEDIAYGEKHATTIENYQDR